ncbi:hypothetical protein BOO86_21810 [Mycobacterium sp. CBMA 234]|nr:hypothetical protein [Mycolicibacterium sp. CBMA 234]
MMVARRLAGRVPRTGREMLLLGALPTPCPSLIDDGRSMAGFMIAFVVPSIHKVGSAICRDSSTAPV